MNSFSKLLSLIHTFFPTFVTMDSSELERHIVDFFQTIIKLEDKAARVLDINLKSGNTIKIGGHSAYTKRT